MATQAFEFSRAHPFSDSSEAGMIARLEKRIARADVLIKQQRTGLDAVHAATIPSEGAAAGATVLAPPLPDPGK